MIDLLYVCFNRLVYTRESFIALRDNTDWDEVDTLFIHDDGSKDGSDLWLRRNLDTIEANVVFHGERLGGPVAAMNWYLDNSSPDVQMFAKIDNDMVVCPGWLGDMLKTMTQHPELDILGMEPFVGQPTPCPSPREITEAVHIGGKGLIRHRAFGHCRMVPKGYFGFTEWQQKHPDIQKAWVTPDLPCFGLDQLPFEPWLALSQEYVALGWHRHWPPYSVDATGYWDWFTPAYEVGAA